MLERSNDQIDDIPTPVKEQRTIRVDHWIELLSAAMLALATVATAWCGYQSALWNGEQIQHLANVSAADVRAVRFASAVDQKIGLHVGLFGQWAAADSTNNTILADFLFNHFPEPLKAASVAWLETDPYTNLKAPATPFNMPEYVLVENTALADWDARSAAESNAANKASGISNRYLLFTIIFASVLFFSGISGKFRSQVLDIAVLVLGVLAFLAGVIILFSTPAL